MRVGQVNWMLVATIFLGCISWGIAPATASAQTYADISHRNDCTRNINARTDALQRHQWDLLVSSARQYISNCHDLFRGNNEEVMALADIGVGLIEQGKFEDAFPILARCVTIKPDAAICFVHLGEALEGLRRTEDARKAYQQTISIGGYDDLSAAAIARARRDLAELPAEGQPPKPERSSGGEPDVPAESRKFGTGFFVSAEGHILTNNHVVAGCKTLTTSDGKPLEVLNRNVDSDLALLLQPNRSREEQKLVDILRRASLLDDENRQYIWNAYHAKNSKDDFVSVLDKFDLSDDEKQAICDLRFKRSHDESMSMPVAVFRTGPAPKLGDAVVAFGFPLPGVLSSEGNVSTGIISATSGLGNDVRYIQISAPVQAGNSGGPLFDSSGHVIGVVVAKLDAVKIAQITGDIPQNVNFAVQWSAVRAFLDEAGVPYQKEISQHATATRNIAAAAVRVAVTIECIE
jgi:S1-C subfamily serine protease